MMPTYRKLLVTTDLSPIGNAAIPHAYGILSGRGGTVILCHVVDAQEIPSPLYARYAPKQSLPGQEHPDRPQTMISALEALVPEEASADGSITTEVRVVEARTPTPEAICHEAAALEVDLIVMASHGHSGVKHLILGSVAENVVRIADRPILIVRGPE
jgi:nucleotide-binding universal stress UspA family protein